MWRDKNEISEIMGFVRIIWKNNVQEAYLPKMSISGQIVSEIIAQLCLENFIQTLLNFFGSTQKKNYKGLYGDFWVQLGYDLRDNNYFAPKCSFLASTPLGRCSFRISLQIPPFQKFHFYYVITLVLCLLMVMITSTCMIKLANS